MVARGAGIASRGDGHPEPGQPLKMFGEWNSSSQSQSFLEKPVTPRTEAELRRLIDHLGNPDAMAQ